MGTFHDDKGPLHGITVVVDTAGSQVMIGRCHEQTEREVVLHGADVHDEAAEDAAKATWVKRAAKWGVFPRHRVLKVPNEEVASITPLGQVSRF